MTININKVEVFLEKKVQISSFEPVNLKLGYTADVEAENPEEITDAANYLIGQVKEIVNKQIEQIIEEELQRNKTSDTVNVGTVENVSVNVNGQKQQVNVPTPPAPPKKEDVVIINYNKMPYTLKVTEDYKNMTCPVCGGKLYLNTNKSNGNQFFGCGNWKTTGCKFSANLDDVKALVEQANTVYENPVVPVYQPEIVNNSDDDDLPF